MQPRVHPVGLDKHAFLSCSVLACFTHHRGFRRPDRSLFFSLLLLPPLLVDDASSCLSHPCALLRFLPLPIPHGCPQLYVIFCTQGRRQAQCHSSTRSSHNFRPCSRRAAGFCADSECILCLQWRWWCHCVRYKWQLFLSNHYVCTKPHDFFLALEANCYLFRLYFLRWLDLFHRRRSNRWQRPIRESEHSSKFWSHPNQ